MLSIKDRQHKGIKKNLSRSLERDLVLLEILLSFSWIPLEVVLHTASLRSREKYDSGA
jgi:hypothetical protein